MKSLVRPNWLLMLAVVLFSLTSAFAQTAATATSSTSADVSNVVDVIGDGKIDWSKDELRAQGIGFAPAFAKTPGQITVLAREAAIAAAERNLIKVINGVHVSSETTVENLVLSKDIIITHVNGLVQGAVIVSEQPYQDNGYEVVLAINLHGDTASLAQSIDLADQFKHANPAATIVPPAPSDSATNIAPAVQPSVIPTAPANGYTGVVIDCRGLGLCRSMCPRILDQNNANLWSTLTVSEEIINERGIAGYYQSADDPTLAERVGARPLLVKALRASGGKVFKTDAVIGPADAELVRSEDTKSLFLEKLNVAFVVDKDK